MFQVKQMLIHLHCENFTLKIIPEWVMKNVVKECYEHTVSYSRVFIINFLAAAC